MLRAHGSSGLIFDCRVISHRFVTMPSQHCRAGDTADAPVSLYHWCMCVCVCVCEEEVR